MKPDWEKRSEDGKEPRRTLHLQANGHVCVRVGIGSMCLRMFALTIVVISGAHVCRTTGKVPCQNVAALGTYPE